VNTGNRKVLSRLSLGALVLMVSTQAGRIGEDGSGAMWIAPELLAAKTRVEPCNRRNPASTRDVVFEVIRLEDHPDSPHFETRQGAVAFEWNAATGELSFAGTSRGEIFPDVKGVAHRATHLEARSCGS
jgi:hypothetical protein